MFKKSMPLSNFIAVGLWWCQNKIVKGHSQLALSSICICFKHHLKNVVHFEIFTFAMFHLSFLSWFYSGKILHISYGTSGVYSTIVLQTLIVRYSVFFCQSGIPQVSHYIWNICKWSCNHHNKLSIRTFISIWCWISKFRPTFISYTMYLISKIHLTLSGFH